MIIMLGRVESIYHDYGGFVDLCHFVFTTLLKNFADRRVVEIISSKKEPFHKGF